MSLQVLVAGKTRTLRFFLSMAVAWSVLACALVLVVCGFHVAAPVAYLLVLIPGLPLCAMVVVAVWGRASQADRYLRQYFVGAILVAGALVFLTLLLVCFVLLFVRSMVMAEIVSILPIATGIVPAIVLLLPRRMLEGGKLPEPSPLRVKLATPVLRRIFRMAALYIFYDLLSFASSILFDHYTLTGILAWAVALLPVLPVFGLIPIYRKYMAEEQDEFQRHLFHQSILWALVGTLIIASVMGRLEEQTLIFHRHPGYFQPYTIFPLFWWLQLEAVFIINAVQAVREKRSR